MALRFPQTRILVVSLKGATDRREMFARRAAEAGVEWEYFDACETLAEGLVYDEEGARLHKGRPLTKGEIGCYSSHYSLWRQLMSDSAEQYIVLEDDVLVDWRMIEMIAQTDLLKSGVEYLRLYYKLPSQHLIRKRRFIVRTRTLVELFSPAYGTQGYVMTKQGAEKLLANLHRVTLPIDDKMDRFWDHGVPNLSLFPFALIEEPAESTIGDDRFTAKDETLRRKLYLARDRLKRKLAMRRRLRLERRWPDVVPFDPGS